MSKDLTIPCVRLSDRIVRRYPFVVVDVAHVVAAIRIVFSFNALKNFCQLDSILLF